MMKKARNKVEGKAIGIKKLIEKRKAWSRALCWKSIVMKKVERYMSSLLIKKRKAAAEIDDNEIRS